MVSDDRIREAREKKKLSRAELAKLVSVSPTAVWNWEERGRKPRPEVLVEIAKALGVTEKWLRHGSGDAEDEGDSAIIEIVERAKREIAGALKVPSSRIEVKVTYKG
jgi:transcriptional regulator with XRE-family HTH domain